MKISSDATSRQRTATINQLTDLLSLLKRLESLPAKVTTDSRGQLILSTRFGNIQPEGRLPLQPGQQVQITLNANSGKPTVTPVPTEARQSGVEKVILDVQQNRDLAQLLRLDRPTLGKVVNQSPGSTQVQFAGVQLALPRIAKLNPGQLLVARLGTQNNQIELRIVERKPLLKALLAQLVTKAPSDKGQAAPLTTLFQNLDQIRTQLPPPSVATQNPRGTDTAVNTPATHNSGSSIAPPLTFTQLLPDLSAPQSKVLAQWISTFLSQRPNTSASLAQSQSINPVQFIQQASKGELTPAQIEKVLTTALSVKPESQASQSNQTPAQEARLLLEIQQLQSKETARLIEQIATQAQTQRTSVNLQQELQQPLAFALALPIVEGKQIKQLNIDVDQREQTTFEEHRGWDAKLSFELSGLGRIHCHIYLKGSQVSGNFYCEQDSTRELIEGELSAFRKQLVKAGFDPGELNAYPAANKPNRADDALKITESLLDIRV